jgi:ubiquinone/menaquinone biosynthesis C-methylase UbiE
MSNTFTGDDLQADIAFLDAVRAGPAAAVRKSQLATVLEVHESDTVLEIGPGTGDDLQHFARAARSGVAIGVELSEGLAREAARRAEGLSNVSLVVADVRHLPIRDHAADAVYVERVLQHVPQVDLALREIVRACRHGGRLLAFEPDQELRAHDHPDGDTERLLRARASARFANPTIGRRLYGLLLRAGFVDVAVEGTITCTLGASTDVRTQVDEAVEAGDLDQERGAAYLVDLERLQMAGLGFAVWVAFEAHARRAPEPAVLGTQDG